MGGSLNTGPLIQNPQDADAGESCPRWVRRWGPCVQSLPAELQALLAAASPIPCGGTVLGQEGWLLPKGKFCVGGSQPLSQRRWWFHQTLVLVGLVYCRYFLKKKKLFAISCQYLKDTYFSLSKKSISFYSVNHFSNEKFCSFGTPFF